MKIGTFIKQKRKFNNYTLEKLAELSGVSKSALSRIERNESSQFEPISRVLASLGYTAEDATKAGVNWWTDEAESEDLDVVFNWLRSQDSKLIKKLRNIVDYLENSED